MAADSPNLPTSWLTAWHTCCFEAATRSHPTNSEPPVWGQQKGVTLTCSDFPVFDRCAKGIFPKGIWECTRFPLLRWEKGSETPSCDGEKGLRLPRSSCSDLGNEGVLDPLRESQTLLPTVKGKTPDIPNLLSENPLSATHEFSSEHHFKPL